MPAHLYHFCQYEFLYTSDYMLLKPISAAGDRPLLVQTAPQPVIRGFEPDGVDSLCPHCNNSIILQQVVEGEVYDVAFQCFACTRICTAPQFPTGRGLGGVLVQIRAGVYAAGPTYTNECHAVIIGWPGIEQRAKETGKPLAPPKQQSPVVTDVAAIRTLLTQAHNVFSQILPTLALRDQRARQHRTTAPESRHRLPFLTNQLEETIKSIEGGVDEIDIISFLELHRICDLFSRWRKDPSFPMLLSSAKDPRNFNHNVAVLAAASVLIDAGLGAELFIDPSRRAPDLRIQIALRRHFMVEVKTPELLQRRPGVALGAPHDRDLIRRCLDEANGQLTPPTPGVLLIGGAFWGNDFQLLEEEGRQLWERIGTRRRHLAAVLFISTGIQYARRADTMSVPFDWAQVNWLPNIDGRWIPNPHYNGDVRLDFPHSFLGEYKLSFQGAVTDSNSKNQ